MLSAFGLISGVGLNLALALTVLLGLEIVLLYYLTWEFLGKENSLVYGALTFTFIWLVVFGVYSDSLISVGISSDLLFIMLIGFAVISTVLGVVPLVIYVTKLSSFSGLRKQYDSYRQQYEQRDSSGELQGTIGLVNKYMDCSKELASVEANLKNVDQAFNSIQEKYNVAKKSPELIFSALDETTRVTMPFARPNINYVVLGLGGTGIDLMTALIDHLDSAGAFAEGEVNPYAFLAFDTDVRKLLNLNTKYEKKPLVLELLHSKPELNNSLTENNILLSNPWIQGEPVSIMSGTGNRRGIGAAAYNVIGDNLVDFMVQEIDKLRQRSPQSSWVLIVLNSLGGGTGSGSFIRLTIDLLKNLEKILIRNPLVLWFGILPRNSEGDIYKVNAYAAIKELQFLFERSERRFGESVDASAMHNPFSSCFLLSRESPSQKRDEELADALVHFMSEIGFVPSGHTPDVRLDINDIRTRLGYAANTFGTLNYYQVYFPASILSWYRNFAKPVAEANKKKFDDTMKKADELLKSAEASEIASENYITSVDEFNKDKLMQFKELHAYKKWTEEVQSWTDKLNSFVSKLKSDYDFEALKMQVNTLRQSTIFKVGQNRDNTIALVENEKRKLINPDVSDVYKQVPILDPDTFDLSQLTDPASTLRSLMEKSGKLDLLRDFLRPLTFPLGDVGMPLANLDFVQMKRPINLGASGTEFIEAYQPRMIGKDKYGNKIIESPRIKSVILLASSCVDNLSPPVFPTTDEIRGNLMSSVEEEGNAEVSFNKVPIKRFTTSVYWLLAGLHIWKLLPNEPPVLKDLAYLSDAYEKAAAGRREDMLDLFRNHTLFYNDPKSLERFIGPSTKKDFISIRNRTTEFWANYNPSDIAVSIWGTLFLSYIYDSAGAFNENLMNFDNFISPVASVSDISELDLKELRNSYDELVASIQQKLIPDLSILTDSYKTLENVKSDVAEGLNKVLEQLTMIQDNTSKFLISIDTYKKRLSQLKADDLISKRNIQQVTSMLNDLQRILKSLLNSVKGVVSGKPLSAL